MKPAQRLSLKAVIAACTILLLTGLLAVPAGLSAQTRALSGSEYQVKAGFIYNFAKFVEWPQGTFNHDNDPLILCIVSNNPESDVFFSLNSKTVGGRKIQVRKYEDMKDIGTCHILFLDSIDKTLIQEGLKTVRDRSVLTISHIKGFTQQGGIINFFIEEGRLRFEVNLDAARRCGLKLGSQLLVSAEIIAREQK
ncbi:MAG: YfiR family protein [bacterium]